MPIYLYRCAQGHESEIAHGMGETVSVHCSKCGNTLRRVYLMPNVKKSGFINPSPAIQAWLNDRPAAKDRLAEKQAARKE